MTLIELEKEEDLVTTDDGRRVRVVGARSPMTVLTVYGCSFSQHVMQAGLTLAENATIGALTLWLQILVYQNLEPSLENCHHLCICHVSQAIYATSFVVLPSTDGDH